MRLLLIEDNPSDARLLHEMLRVDPEFTVTTVGRVDEGIARLGESTYDLILLDLSLPDGVGINTFRRVHCAVRTVPIVVLTGHDDKDLAMTAVREGAQDFLIKGHIDRDLLVRVIRYACERHRLLAQLENLALVDALTGLFNRRGFVTVAEEQMKLARRMGHSMAVAFVDLDGMKAINDKLGHEAGDQALVATAAILKSTFRDSDVIARLGGDEFVILAIGADRRAANRLHKRLKDAVRHDQQAMSSPPLSLSVGFAFYNPVAPTATSIEQLIKRADGEMYADKQSRRAGRDNPSAAPTRKKRSPLPLAQ